MGSSRESIFLAEHGMAAARCFRSVFQPIYGLAYQRPVGYEVLLRESHADGSLHTPAEFTGHRRGTIFGAIDRKSHALHLENSAHAMPDDHWLFLNISASTMRRPGYAGRLAARAEQCGLPSGRIVLEILEDADCEGTDLAMTVEGFRAAGFLIALDDFGVGYSNLARLVRLRPDVVKLDQSLLRTVGIDGQLLAHLVRLLHEKGILVVAEGVETDDELLATVQANVDFAQGFFLGSPQIAPVADRVAAARIEDAYEGLSGMIAAPQAPDGFSAALGRAIPDLIAGKPPQTCFADLLVMPGCVGCFVLDGRGRQRGPTLWGPDAQSADQRFAPMAEFASARWDNREYFRLALSHPGHVVQSQRSRSVNGAQLCLTIAVALQYFGQPQIFGVDVALAY
ncbi:EAL domain-containing protein [Paraburkholderia sp. IW21]